MAMLGIALTVAGLLVVGVGGTGAYLYATDYKVDATVQGKDCTRGEVDVKAKLFGLDHTVQDVPLQQCTLLNKGNFVEYRIKSGRTTLWDVEGGQCIYDSLNGPGCGRSGSAGSIFG